jgi:hypothetical protein
VRAGDTPRPAHPDRRTRRQAPSLAPMRRVARGVPARMKRRVVGQIGGPRHSISPACLGPRRNPANSIPAEYGRGRSAAPRRARGNRRRRRRRALPGNRRCGESLPVRATWTRPREPRARVFQTGRPGYATIEVRTTVAQSIRVTLVHANRPAWFSARRGQYRWQWVLWPHAPRSNAGRAVLGQYSIGAPNPAMSAGIRAFASGNCVAGAAFRLLKYHAANRHDLKGWGSPHVQDVDP